MAELVAVRSFATVEEISAAIALTQVLQATGVEVLAYLGKDNFGLPLQERLPTTGVKFYQPRNYKNELTLKLDLNGREIKGVRWQQEGEEVKLKVELDYVETRELDSNHENKTKGDAQGKNLDLAPSTKGRFEQIYLVGDFTDISQLEDYGFFAKNTDLEGVEFIRDFSTENPEAGLQTTSQTTQLQALVAEAAKSRGVNLGPKAQKLVRLKETDYTITREEYRLMTNFWLGEVENAEFSRLLGLIKLTNQLRPQFDFALTVSESEEPTDTGSLLKFNSGKLAAIEPNYGQSPQSSYRQFNGWAIQKINAKNNRQDALVGLESGTETINTG